jgi:2-phosphosulfolactate phosphatase
VLLPQVLRALAPGVRALEVLFTPADFAALSQRNLQDAVCVVFDVLRATSTMLQGLANGASAILPAADIPSALALKVKLPQALLAGERNGLRISAAVSGGPEFDLGNSPREFTSERVSGRTIIMTTTNGTRALHACRGARAVWVASFANLGAIAARLTFESPARLVVVCSGTQEQSAFEDVLGAGALVDRLWPHFEDEGTTVDDAAVVARTTFLTHQKNLLGAVRQGRNGRRLLGIPELAPDVPLCLTLDRLDLLARLEADGAVRTVH